MRIKIEYKDWLLINRSNIEPNIGDNVYYNNQPNKVKLISGNVVELYDNIFINVYSDSLKADINYPIIERN